MSTKSLPGTTTVPGSAICASTEERSDSSMSVAASSSVPADACSQIPERIWTVGRIETARATTASFSTSSSREQVNLRPEPTTVSTWFII
jgi:chitodextrinase